MQTGSPIFAVGRHDAKGGQVWIPNSEIIMDPEESMNGNSVGIDSTAWVASLTGN
jgi:hypothetical protein